MLDKSLRFAAVSTFALAVAAFSGTAWAQTEPAPPAGAADPGAGPTPPPTDPPATGDAKPPTAEPSGQTGTSPHMSATDPATPPPASDPNGLLADFDETQGDNGIRELSDRSYWFLGVRFRDFIIPKFLINAFVDGGATVNAFTFGPELTYRKGHLEIDMALSYADYSMDPFLFKQHDEPERAYELVSSDLKLFVASVDILGSIPIDRDGRFTFLIGGGVGVAGVVGDLYRSQAYPAEFDRNPGAGFVTGNPDDASDWRQCRGAGVPPALDSTGRNYCDASNNHYAGYTEASMANGGDLPFLVPYLALPHLALRVKPFKNFQARLDTGFSITGFFFGLGAGYRLPI